MKKLLVALSSIALITMSGSAAAAGAVSGSLSVLLSIGSGCTVSGGTSGSSGNTFGTLDFGTHSALDNSIDAQSTGSSAALNVKCTTLLPYSIGLDNGLAPAGSVRQLQSGVNRVAYNLYQDSARLLPWDNAVNKMPGIGTGANIPLNIYGRVPSNVTAPATGAYTDTVVVTVSW